MGSIEAGCQPAFTDGDIARLSEGPGQSTRGCCYQVIEGGGMSGMRTLIFDRLAFDRPHCQSGDQTTKEQAIHNSNRDRYNHRCGH